MKNKPSVMIVCAEYPPHVEGGLGIHYYELIEELKKICHVDLICMGKKDSKNLEIKGDLTIHRVKVPKLFPLNHILFNILVFLKSLQIKKDIVHLCAPYGIINVLLKTKPTVVKIHTLYDSQKGNFFYRKIIFPLASFMDKMYIKKSDKIITTSKFMKKSILEKINIDSKKVIEIPNGINKDFFLKNTNKNELRKKMNFSVKDNLILYVGRFVERKGALNIIEAVPKIIKENKNTKFILIGGGFNEGSAYESKMNKRIKELNINKQINIVNWIDRNKLLKYYQISDIFVHPASFEPFGNIILEAMASGLPIISSASGGPEEIIENNGIILKDNSPEKIVNSVNYLLKNKKIMQSLSKKSIARAKMFSWKKNAEKTKEIYQAVLIKNENKQK